MTLCTAGQLIQYFILLFLLFYRRWAFHTRGLYVPRILITFWQSFSSLVSMTWETESSKYLHPLPSIFSRAPILRGEKVQCIYIPCNLNILKSSNLKRWESPHHLRPLPSIDADKASLIGSVPCVTVLTFQNKTGIHRIKCKHMSNETYDHITKVTWFEMRGFSKQVWIYSNQIIYIYYKIFFCSVKFQ